jgi:hypothetical protein
MDNRKSEQFREQVSQRMTRHGFARKNKVHPFFITWVNMRNRCYNPKNNRYSTYGARGIKVCKRWLIFENFRKDMFNTWRSGLQIDRINNNKDYTPSNCRWTTPKQNSRDRTNTRKVYYQGKNIPLVELAEKYGIKRATLEKRLSSGWSIEKAIKQPIRKSKRWHKYEDNPTYPNRSVLIHRI